MSPDLRNFSEVFVLLQQEGYLIRSCLLSGMESLRKANIGDAKGLFYSAFLNLSMGLERFMKVILIIDYMVNNDLAPPPFQNVKRYGHGLEDLFSNCTDLAEAYNVDGFVPLEEESIDNEILKFLSAFGEGARYYNLNSITLGAIGGDPLAQWQAIVDRIVEEDLSDRIRRRISNEGAVLAAFLEEGATHQQIGLNQAILSSAEVATIPRLIDASAPYAVYRIFRILQSLKRVLNVAEDAAREIDAETAGLCNIPYMQEFLTFLNYDRRDVLRKRKWC